MSYPGGTLIMAASLATSPTAADAPGAVAATSPTPALAANSNASEFVPIDEQQPGRKHELCCPHCKSPGNRRSSREVTTTFREIFYICRNPVCGHSWKASLTYEYGLSPSAIPDPALDLPMRVMDRAAALVALANARAAAPDPDSPTFFDT